MLEVKWLAQITVRIHLSGGAGRICLRKCDATWILGRPEPFGASYSTSTTAT